MQRFCLVLTMVLTFTASLTRAQTASDVVWVQIEARPTYEEALERVQAYAQTLEDVNGFALRGGWYAIALGPYLPEDAQTVLRGYRAQGLIPGDSYVALSETYTQQYWPTGSDILGLGNIASIASPDTIAPAAAAAPVENIPEVVQDPPQAVAAPDESPSEARRSEGTLTAEERRLLQTALKWAGYYNSTI
ncbi:MAG: peptidoglycan-binding protein, partial [Roseobacter sp.]|nr:peptidoglycan-binding protein [Roseobacter sp.]